MHPSYLAALDHPQPNPMSREVKYALGVGALVAATGLILLYQAKAIAKARNTHADAHVDCVPGQRQGVVRFVNRSGHDSRYTWRLYRYEDDDDWKLYVGEGSRSQLSFAPDTPDEAICDGIRSYFQDLLASER